MVEDVELHFELDTVHGSLVGGLDVKVVGVLGDKEGDVQEDNEDIDEDEMPDNLPLIWSFHHENWFESMHRLPDVESRDNEFLNAEAGQLDLLVDDEWLE